MNELRKIPLKELLELLVELWDSGADYVDIKGTRNKEQDAIYISTRDAYYTTEKQTLTEEDINQLI